MEPADNRSYITVKKNPFDKIILGDMNKCILHDAVTRTHKIVIHTYNFLKLYCIHLLNTSYKYPMI